MNNYLNKRFFLSLVNCRTNAHSHLHNCYPAVTSIRPPISDPPEVIALRKKSALRVTLSRDNVFRIVWQTARRPIVAMLCATWKRKRHNLINDDNPHPRSIAQFSIS